VSVKVPEQPLYFSDTVERPSTSLQDVKKCQSTSQHHSVRENNELVVPDTDTAASRHASRDDNVF